MTLHVETLTSLDTIGRDEWEELTADADTGAGHGYLRFREYMEPGDSLVITARDAGRLTGALHGALTTPRTTMTSNPWKLLATDAFLRLGECAPDAARRHRAEHRALLAAAGAAPGGGAAWQRLAARFGECYVVRGFDTSAVLGPCTRNGETDEEIADVLVRAAQRAALDAGAGAVAFPYVRPGDTALRTALSAAGFRTGVLTAASLFRTEGCGSYAEYLERLSARHRRRHRVERRRLAESGLVTRELDLAHHAARMAELEAATLAKYGATPDVGAIRRARVELAHRHREAVSVPAVEQDGRIIACALHYTDRRSSLFMSFGCDYEVADRSTSYAWAAFYHPIGNALARGVHTVRLGFEGFEAKRQRGATVEPRETWLWVPDADALARLGELLGFLDERNTQHLERFLK